MQRPRYYFLSFLTFLISFIGFIGIKLSIILVAVGIAFLSEKYIGDFGLIIGYITGLVVAGLLFLGLQQITPCLERLDEQVKTLKKYPYTEKYGENFPSPKPEDFGITQAEFKEYNKRFQFEYIKMLFTYGLLITTSVLVIQGKIKGTPALILIGGTIAVAIILNYLFDYWDKKISQKHRYYEKIHKYQDAVHIYYKILDEKLNS